MVNSEENKSSWMVKYFSQPDVEDCVLIEGLPGIANVGKIAIDFIVEQRNAKKVAEFFSYDLPHSVFIKEDNLVGLPKIELYLIKKDKKLKENLLLLSGDVQPASERSCYEFCDIILKYAKSVGCKEIITTGGIGLPRLPKSPKIYCTANEKKIINKYKKIVKLNDKIYGIVGPVVGVTGVMVGLASKYNLPAIALLTETFAHPMYLGMASARNLLNVINNIFGIDIDMKNLDNEIQDLESEILLKTQQLKQVKEIQHGKKDHKLNYIG